MARSAAKTSKKLDVIRAENAVILSERAAVKAANAEAYRLSHSVMADALARAYYR